MVNLNEVTTYNKEGKVAIISLNNPPVNALSFNVRDGIFEAIALAKADSAVEAIILKCDGKTFIAGADITEFGKPPKGKSLSDVQDAIENSPKPVIALIHGNALGGGLEVALVCHYRVSTPDAKFGLPEVNLGILPGAGGTQRLPRIVGIEKSLEMMTSGASISSQEALDSGLIDKICTQKDTLAEAIVFASQIIEDKKPLRKIRDININSDSNTKEIFESFRKKNFKKFRGFAAPEKIIQCVEAAVENKFDQGIKKERELFAELIKGSQSQAMRYYFFASRKAWEIPGINKDDTQKIDSVAIIGAGTMGSGIAMNFLNAGIPVKLIETNQEALDRGVNNIKKNYENSAKKGKFTAEGIQKRLSILESSINLEDVKSVDIVIEAVYENMDVKKQIFTKLDALCKSDAILASNTSALDLNEIASVTKRPESVIGLHFFSPANVMKLLEIVRGAKTSDKVIATSMQLAKKIGKIAVLVGVCNGFVGNRILAQRQREANALLMEGAMPWTIDKVLYQFGFPMGPFAMSDLAGLDLGWSKEKSTSSTIREILCEMDRRGQKTNAGFYDYDEKRNAIPSVLVEDIIKKYSTEHGYKSRDISEQEILERCIYPMINEGAKILEEKIALRASDIDVVWVNGYGWPVYRGGPMHFGDTIGLDKVLSKMEEFESKYGEQFKPSKLLKDLVATGKKFSDLN